MITWYYVTEIEKFVYALCVYNVKLLINNMYNKQYSCRYTYNIFIFYKK